MTTWRRPDPGADSFPPLSLYGNFSWTLAGNLVYAASQWAMLTAIAKLGEPAMVGQFALALAVTAPVMMFANLNLAIVQATDVRREYRFADYLSLRVITSLIALALVVGIVAASDYRGQAAMVVLAVGVAKVVESFSDVLFGLFQQRGRMDVVARSLMAKGPLSLTVMAAAVFFLHSVLWGAALLAVAWAAMLVAYDYRMGVRMLRPTDGATAESIQLRWAPEVWRRLVRLSLPIGVVALVNALLPNIPRYVVAHELGEHALGIFAALAYVIVAGHGVMCALTSATAPRLAACYLAGDRRAFSSLVRRTVAFGAAVGSIMTLLAAIAGRQILTLLYTADYAAHAGVFTWLMAASAILYMSHFLWAGVTAARYFRVQAPLFGASIALSAVTCTLLVPRFGLMGAAAAVFTVAVFHCIAVGVILRIAVHACGKSLHGPARPGSDAAFLENPLAAKYS